MNKSSVKKVPRSFDISVWYNLKHAYFRYNSIRLKICFASVTYWDITEVVKIADDVIGVFSKEFNCNNHMNE